MHVRPSPGRGGCLVNLGECWALTALNPKRADIATDIGASLSTYPNTIPRMTQQRRRLITLSQAHGPEVQAMFPIAVGPNRQCLNDDWSLLSEECVIFRLA
jgi:hypothetical protein